MYNGKAVVLGVEDSPMIRMGAVDLVRSAGYEAVEARDADAAFRILESRNDIDLKRVASYVIQDSFDE
jgi:two-component system, response regulator PdtaR